MAHTLIKRKVSEDKIIVTGMPVCVKSGKPVNKDKVLYKYAVPKDKKLALVLAGAREPAPYKFMRKTLNESIKLLGKMDDMYFVICVGKDKDYEKKLNWLITKYRCKNIFVCQYINKLSKLMSIADVALIKPGGLIISECASIGLPVLLVGKNYGQENANRRYLIDNDAAFHATTSLGVVNYITQMMNNKKLYNELKTNISKLANKNSASDIANVIFDIIGSEPQSNRKHHKSIYISKKATHT